jgi:hypothetical protein
MPRVTAVGLTPSILAADRVPILMVHDRKSAQWNA